jgi:hypothetical protein
MRLGVHAAPLLMSSLQFTSQILMASAVLKLGIVKRLKPADLSWQQYFVQGAQQMNALPQCAFCFPVSW